MSRAELTSFSIHFPVKSVCKQIKRPRVLLVVELLAFSVFASEAI